MKGFAKSEFYTILGDFFNSAPHPAPAVLLRDLHLQDTQKWTQPLQEFNRDKSVGFWGDDGAGTVLVD